MSGSSHEQELPHRVSNGVNGMLLWETADNPVTLEVYASAGARVLRHRNLS
jgi:hypothetical protein